MRRMFRHFTQTHLFIFLGFYIVFAALTALVLNLQSESDRREAPLVSATLASISGPFTGAIARHYQSCCWDFSLSIFPYSAALLGLGVLAQIVALPCKCCERTMRASPRGVSASLAGSAASSSRLPTRFHR